MELKWITKDVSRHISYSDISITVNKNCGKEQIRIAFKNSCYKRFSLTGYAVIAVEPRRLYFKASEENKGFKFTSFNPDQSACSIKILAENIPNYKRLLGDFTLRCDKKLNLYFIDLPEA